MTLQEFKSQLLQLSPAEQSQIVQLLIQNLTNSWQGIEKTPGVVGGSARLAGTRIPIWDLVQYRRMGATDAKILEAYPQLGAVQLAQA